MFANRLKFLQSRVNQFFLKQVVLVGISCSTSKAYIKKLEKIADECGTNRGAGQEEQPKDFSFYTGNRWVLCTCPRGKTLKAFREGERNDMCPKLHDISEVVVQPLQKSEWNDAENL